MEEPGFVAMNFDYSICDHCDSIDYTVQIEKSWSWGDISVITEPRAQASRPEFGSSEST